MIQLEFLPCEDSDVSFSEIFAPFINESSFFIESEWLSTRHDNLVADINLASVNGFTQPKLFRDYYYSIAHNCLNTLHLHIKELEQNALIQVLDNMKSNIRILIDNTVHSVMEEIDADENDEMRSVSVLEFKNPKLAESLDCIDSIDYMMLNVAISPYSDMWLSVANEISQNIEHFKFSKLYPSSAFKISSPKIKANISVQQLAALFRILKESGIIEIDNVVQFSMLVASVFETKRAKNLGHSGFKNDFDTPKAPAMTYWTGKLNEIEEKIAYLEEKYSR